MVGMRVTGVGLRMRLLEGGNSQCGMPLVELVFHYRSHFLQF